ncbi:hypothetical protein U9M48_030121 [Paspalum notatum var. saurae]|uniref:Disease resistance N-terminal domain-containing protein n=1 Tax=Paspalum notatum var. saurae TaxID=547442 RepID=A0AAQ3X3E9_PASNO
MAAEVPATIVVRPMLSMVKEKASSYLLDQYNAMEGMEDQHKLLKRKLPAVLDVIADAEEQATKHREGVKAWLSMRSERWPTRLAMSWMSPYEALRHKARAEGNYTELGMDVIKIFPSHNHFVFCYKMANKLRTILQELDVLIVEMNTFRFEFKPQSSMSLKRRKTYPYISGHFVNIAGESRAKEKKEIVDTLLAEGSNMGLMVLPIVGMAGMGKTAIAYI